MHRWKEAQARVAPGSMRPELPLVHFERRVLGLGAQCLVSCAKHQPVELPLAPP